MLLVSYDQAYTENEDFRWLGACKESFPHATECSDRPGPVADNTSHVDDFLPG
jgi:hypothetical protein